MKRREILRLAAALAAFGLPGRAFAEPAGRPKVLLDHLDFPEKLGGKQYRKFLERQLKREVFRVDWGASSDSTIQYRFQVTELNVTIGNQVLTVSCSALGHLPNGRTARGRISFSGNPKDHRKLVEHVLAIVARGVIERLAEIERTRREQW